jgi:hypothetical protein
MAKKAAGSAAFFVAAKQSPEARPKVDFLNR